MSHWAKETKAKLPKCDIWSPTLLGKVRRLSATVKYKDNSNMGFVLKELEKCLIFQEKLEREKNKCNLLSRGKNKEKIHWDNVVDNLNGRLRSKDHVYRQLKFCRTYVISGGSNEY